MATPVANSGTVRFGAFEADLRSGELRMDGLKIKLEGQPFQILAALLARPGQLVTREELQKKLWPNETFVDFEQGINAAVKRLRQALEDSADKPRFIETLPRRGYRFIGHIENGPPQSATEESHLEPIANTEEPFGNGQTTQTVLASGATPRWRGILIGTAAITALGLLVLGLNPVGIRDRLLGRPRAGEITAIAVLPLENLTGDPEQEYFVDGMTEALITELGKISSLRVISRTSAMAFKGAKKPLPEIARELGVDAVLEGAVFRSGDRVRITARVIHLSQERTLLSDSYERDLRDVSALQSEIALVVADEIRAKVLSQEQARLARTQPVNPRAYEAFLKGRYLQARRNPEDMRKALAYFQLALEIDPSYAPAYIGIVDCYSIGGGRHMGVRIQEADARMKEAARKAIALDDTTAAAHYALAMVKWHEWDFPGAEREFRQALELNPGDVQVRQHYAHYLLSVRRPVDARREIEHALALDPLSPMFTVDLGHTYAYARQYPEAIQQGKKALAMEPGYLYARMMLGWAYWKQGQVQGAFAVGWPNPFRPEQTRRAKEIYERAGMRPMLEWIVRDVENNNGTGDFYSRSSHIALWYAVLGDRRKALSWTERAVQEHDPWLPMDLAEPIFDPLRSDPRFQNLLRRIGLPE
jgi:TolB-like protein/DNA-binding winged helix-turn-helix (wHTH) protein/cytochrome c-type biogenesis protein CcmH/NrfG